MAELQLAFQPSAGERSSDMAQHIRIYIVAMFLHIPIPNAIVWIDGVVMASSGLNVVAHLVNLSHFFFLDFLSFLDFFLSSFSASSAAFFFLRPRPQLPNRLSRFPRAPGRWAMGFSGRPRAARQRSLTPHPLTSGLRASRAAA